MPFNIAMKPKNQHIPIIKLTYIYLIRLPIRLSKKYQVKQVNHEVGKKYSRESTYKNPNVHIKIIIGAWAAMLFCYLMVNFFDLIFFGEADW